MPPGHLCLSISPSAHLSRHLVPFFPFFFLFYFLLSFSLLPFSVFFVFRLSPASPSSLFFASMLSLVADSVIVSVLHPFPARLASMQICVFPLCAFFLLGCFFIFFGFSSRPSLFRFRLGRRFVSSCLFLVGSMLPPRFMLRLAQRIICI